MKENIHVAITRKVKPGYEEAFEQAIQEFFAKTTRRQGSLGAQLIRPFPGSSTTTFGILRSFKSTEDRDAFYQSEDFLKWQEKIKPMVQGEYSRKELHGLEAFFEDPSILKHPPKWKMAFVTWLGVWPTVFIISQLLSIHKPTCTCRHRGGYFFGCACTQLDRDAFTNKTIPPLVETRVDLGGPIEDIHEIRTILIQRQNLNT